MITGRVTVVRNDFARIGRELRENAAKATGETVFDLESEIKQHIVAVGAVDTGLMLNSTQGHHETGALEGDVTTAAEYWPYVNYGAQGRPARPFVEPAVDVVQPRHTARVKKAIGE